MRTSLDDRANRRSIVGTIRRRLLVNAVVDPDEAASHLPEGVRPHVTEVGTVVGCCLLELDDVTPLALPWVTGRNVGAVAHRISVEWDDHGETVVGVYVPVRHADSQLVVALGGRLFPGVHRRARINVVESTEELKWEASDARTADELGIDVTVKRSVDQLPTRHSDRVVTDVCLAASIGLSPRRGKAGVEAVRMEPAHRRVCPVNINELRSPFLARFHTAAPTSACLMENVAVSWTPAPTPQLTPTGALS